MNLKQIREKTDQEILKHIKERKEELFRLRFRKVTDVIENPALLRQLRKEIARLETILRERQLKIKKEYKLNEKKT